MSNIYARQILQAQEQIQRKGMLVQWIKRSEATDPATPWKQNDATIMAQSCFMLFLPVNVGKFGASGSQRVQGFGTDGENQVSNEMAIMGSQSFAPALNDYVKRGSEQLRIVGIDILRPNGVPVLYWLFFAK